MAAKKDDKDTEDFAQPSDAPEGIPNKVPAPGTIIKEYVQNGLRYKRVVTEDGGTVDMRV